MFTPLSTPLRRSLPTIDYVSIVRSVYKDRRAMLWGTVASALGAAVAAHKIGSLLLLGHGVLLLILAITRYLSMRRFMLADIGSEDAEAAQYWEGRATFFGYFAAFAYGSWAFSSIAFGNDSFVELVAVSATVASMVGIAMRNFGLDRLMTAQIIGMGGPMALAFLLRGDLYHTVLAALFIPTLTSFRTLGRDVRAILLAAVHDRVATSRLADQLDLALKTMQHGVCMLDENGVIAVVNERAQQTFSGIGAGAWAGQTFSDLMAEAVANKVLTRGSADRLLRIIETESSGKVLLKLSADYYCEVTISSQEDRTVLLFENVTDRIRVEERIGEMARFDSLTHLANRAHFTEEVESDLARKRRQGGAAQAMLAIIDLDDFKHINDSLGHLVGDRVLSEAARRIGAVMHRKSLLARFGGDEFVIFRSGEVTQNDIAAEASSILRAFSQPLIIDGQRLEVRLSMGIVSLPAGEADLDTLIARADLALYSAKARGKGQWELFAEQMDVDYRYRQRLKADLRQAIAAESLRLVYQPQVNAHTRKVEGCEALARWDHPELGPIPPTLFIGLAEEIGAISDITRWALATATAECMNWPENLTVSVNVSARDVRSASLPTAIDRALERSGLPPNRLEIEVTESMLIEERDLAAERLSELAARGIGIALDDFGTGYSSLSYLHSMPFTKLKVDRAFSTGISQDDRALKLMANVAQLGKDLDLTVTAEGVETEEQLTTLAELTHIDQVQGFLFGVPLPAAEVRKLIRSLSGSPDEPAVARA